MNSEAETEKELQQQLMKLNDELDKQTERNTKKINEAQIENDKIKQKCWKEKEQIENMKVELMELRRFYKVREEQRKPKSSMSSIQRHTKTHTNSKNKK